MAAILAVQLGCATPQRTKGVALVASGIAAMGVSLFALRRGPFGPADYLMGIGWGAAVVGTVEYTR